MVLEMCHSCCHSLKRADKQQPCTDKALQFEIRQNPCLVGSLSSMASPKQETISTNTKKTLFSL